MKALIIVVSLTFAFMASSCFNPDDYERVDPNEVIRLSQPGVSSGPADGVTPIEIQAEIAADAPRDRRSVVFKATRGSFVSGTGDSVLVQADDRNIAVARLRSKTVGSSTISAKMLGISAANTVSVDFIKAYPEAIRVTVDSFAIFNNFQSEVLITAHLSKENGGFPSKGHEVQFFVMDQSGSPVGHFLNGINSASSDESGKVNIRYSAGETDYTGTLTITAKTASDSEQNTLAATTTLNLTTKN